MNADFADGFDTGFPWEGSDNFPFGGNTNGTIFEDAKDGTHSPRNDEPQTTHLNFESLTADQVANLSSTVINTLTAPQLRSTVVGTQRSVLASLYYTQLEAISATALRGLSLDDLMQTSVLTPNGRVITVLQAMPWANLSSLSSKVIGALTVEQLELMNLQEQNFTNSGKTLLQGLTNEQILELSHKTIHELSREQLMQTNVSGAAVWHALILDSHTVNLLPAEFQPHNLTATQVTSLFTHLAERQTVNRLNANVIRNIPTASLVNGILGMEIGVARAFITDLSAPQLAAFTPAIVNGLVTSSKDMAAIFLNAGESGSLSIDQFQALLGGATHIGTIHESALSDYLSAWALQSLTPSQINELTASQFVKLLANPTLSKVIFNAPQPDAWSMEQLQAVSASAISQMTQGQYLQFSGGIALFSELQQEAMATNVNLLEIMLTGQTGVWTQDEIAWIVENIPGMIPLTSLPGGGNEPMRGNNGHDREERERLVPHRVSTYRYTSSRTTVLAALSRAGWRRLSEADQNALLENSFLAYVLNNLERPALIDLLQNADLFPRLRGDNILALISPIKNHLNPPINGNIVRWSVEQVTLLMNHVLEGGLQALSTIARYTPNALDNFRLTEADINTLINTDIMSLTYILVHARHVVPEFQLTEAQVTAISQRSGGQKALYYIAKNARSLLPNSLLTEAQVLAFFRLGNDPEYLRDIVAHAPHVLSPDILTENLVNTLINTNTELGLIILSDLLSKRNLNPASLSQGNVSTLLNSELGQKILVNIALIFPMAFQMSEGLVRTLIDGAKKGGLLVLKRTDFAKRLNSNYLTAENLIALIKTEGGPDVLASIARASETALVGSLTRDAVDALIHQRGGLSALATIAQHAPNALDDNLFTVDHVIELLKNKIDGMAALIAIAKSRVNAFGTSMAELSAAQASLLPVDFWAEINTHQLEAMFTSTTLGAEYFNVSSQAPNTPHISEVSLQRIRPEVLLFAYQSSSDEVKKVIINAQKFLTTEQRAIFIYKNYKEFFQPENLNNQSLIKLIQTMALVDAPGFAPTLILGNSIANTTRPNSDILSVQLSQI